MERDRGWAWQVGAGVAGLVTVVASLAIETFSLRPVDWSVVQEWQTLIAGIVAIVAALIGGLFVLHQVRISERHETARIERRFDAERALLPLSLSQLSGYARKSAESLLEIYSQAERHSIPHTARMPVFPEPPLETIRQLRDFIETSPDKIVRLAVSGLLRKIQVQSARMLSLRELPSSNGMTTVTTFNIQDYIIDAADVYARSSGLFDYAREDSGTVSPSVGPADIISALNQIAVRDFDHPDVHQRVSQHYK